MRAPTASVDNAVWRRAGVSHGKRLVPEETAVAFSYDGGTYAVMMATQQDLDDFALGFSLTEGIVAGPGDSGAPMRGLSAPFTAAARSYSPKATKPV